MPQPPYYVSPWSQTVIFHDLMFGDDEDGVVANDGE